MSSPGFDICLQMQLVPLHRGWSDADAERRPAPLIARHGGVGGAMSVPGAGIGGDTPGRGAMTPSRTPARSPSLKKSGKEGGGGRAGGGGRGGGGGGPGDDSDRSFFEDVGLSFPVVVRFVTWTIVTGCHQLNRVLNHCKIM
jgi:hypothetical protein